MARAFETKYPGLRLEAYRAGGSELVPRMIEEAKARRPVFDVLEITLDSLMVSRANDRESYNGFGYNKSQISASAVPKSFDGMLHPDLKGKLGLAYGESANKTIGAMLKIKGEAFVRKLKSQEIKVFTVSSATLVDFIASGEIGASFHIFRNHALVSMEKGSPVGWQPMEIVFTNSGAVALASQPPHAHAALLLIDFLLSDGQKELEKFQYGHPSK